MKSSRFWLKSTSEMDIKPNMIDPPITLHIADAIHKMIKNLLLSLNPNIREMFKSILTQLIPVLVIFPVMEPKILNDAPIVTTLIVKRTTAIISTT